LRKWDTLKRQVRFVALGRWCGIACVVLLLQLSGCGQGPAPGPTANVGEASRNTPNSAAEADRYDLGRDEERGGHTLKKHVGRTDEELRERLRRERNISAASTWTDRETAEVTVAETLRAERGRIENWMRRGYPRANLALHYDAGRPIGRSLRRGDDQTVTCTSAVVVLRADGPDRYFVLTAYPEARE
jgi:Bacterial CdiA-CT RNAse A domain